MSGRQGNFATFHNLQETFSESFTKTSSKRNNQSYFELNCSSRNNLNFTLFALDQCGSMVTLISKHREVISGEKIELTDVMDFSLNGTGIH